MFSHILPSSNSESPEPPEIPVNSDNVRELTECARALHINSKTVALNIAYTDFLTKVENGTIDIHDPIIRTEANIKLYQLRTQMLNCYNQGKHHIPDNREIRNIFTPPRIYTFDFYRNSSNFDFQVEVNKEVNNFLKQRETLLSLQPGFKNDYYRYLEKVTADFKSITKPDKNILDSHIKEVIHNNIKKSKNEITLDIMDNIAMQLGLENLNLDKKKP